MTSTLKTNTECITPRIYVASLADYNSGRLLGRWIDASQGAEHVWNEIREMLAESKEPVAEEWAIHDYEGFGCLKLSEYADIDTVVRVAELVEEHGEVFAELVAHFGGVSGLEEAERYMTEGYRGEFDSLADYAAELVEECYGDALKSLPEFIRYHIDFEGIGDDLEMGGDLFTVRVGRKVHVFDANL